MSQAQAIVGSFESVIFPEFQAAGALKAKIDTGAYSGALHCTKIREEKMGKGSILHFSPFDHPELDISTAKFKVSSVRSSNGEVSERYFIQTTIMIQGQVYPITISLADRSEMKWPVLIGRRFLKEHNLLVDVNRITKVS